MNDALDFRADRIKRAKNRLRDAAENLPQVTRIYGLPIDEFDREDLLHMLVIESKRASRDRDYSGRAVKFLAGCR